MPQQTQTVDGEGTISVPQPDESGHGAEVISDSHATKLDERRFDWQMDWRLVGYTALGVLILMSATVVSYAYNSSKAATTFLSRADQAAEEGKHAEEVRWLSSYLLLHPDDLEKIVRAAISADAAADEATRENITQRIVTARKRLGVAIAYLGTPDDDEDPNSETRRELRERLIERLIQSGGYFFKDVERHVKLLNTEPSDAQAHKWLALAVVGQVQEMLYQVRDGNAIEKEVDYYEWLTNQPPGVVLREAVKRNPHDLDLAGAFIGLLATDPEAFGIAVATDKTDRGAFARAVASLDQPTSDVLDSILLELQDRSDSRAKILLYRYVSSTGDQARAVEVIKDAAAAAADRLANHQSATQRADEDDNDNPDDDEKEDTGLRLSPEAEALVWDYQCVYYGAASIADRAALSVASQEEIDLAAAWLKQLRDLGIDAVPVSPDAVKLAYLVSGLLAESSGDLDTAISLWNEGLTVVNDDNLDLLGNVAWALARRAAESDDDDRVAASDEAAEAIKKFSEAIRARKDELMLLSGDQISLAERTAFAAAITNADWKKRVAEATVIAGQALSTERDQLIIGLLDGLTDDEISLEPQIRIAGISQLTQAYQRQLAWDLAAATLSEAADLFPTNQALIQASGEAWTRAGNRLQAAKQWQRARLSNVPRVRVASLEAEFAYQLRLIPEQRDIQVLRSRVEQLQQVLDKAGDTFAEEQLRLQMLQAQLPPEGVLAEDFLHSEDLADRVSELAKQNPDDTQLQIYAAERLAAAGKADEAEAVARRVESMKDIDPIKQQLLRARVLAASGNHTEATKVLLKSVSDRPDAPVAVALAASEYAKRAGTPELAKEALLKIPADQRTPAIYFALYQIAKLRNQLDEVSKYLNELHRVEGYGNSVSLAADPAKKSPAYSLLIDATQLVEKLLARGSVQRDETDYTRANALITRLLTLRPNWGNAVALRGWLTFATGDYGEAVDELRRGINSGDQQLRTRQLLWQALLTLGRDDEAEREIRTASLATQTDLDPYDEVSIGISIRKGNYDQALASAKQIAAQNLDDPFAWLVYARFALVMRTRAIADSAIAESLDASELLKEAKEAIAKASGLAKSDAQKSAVASSQISLAISVGDRAAVEDVLKMLQKSDVKEADGLMLQAKALVALDRVDEAIEKLRAANELRPDFKAQMTLVRILRSRSRGTDALDVLENAFKQDPNNPTVRTELAAQLIDSGQAIDWDRIAKLLNSDDSVTEQNRLVYALFLASKGSHYQRQESVRLLRDMAGSPTEIGIGAARVQAALMFEMANKYDELTASEQKQFSKDEYLNEARRVFKRLADDDHPALVDLTRYCSFLVTVGEDGDLDEARRVIDRLKSIPGSSMEVLKIEMMLAQQDGDESELPSIIKRWAQDVTEGGRDDGTGGVETVAGEALMRNGFIDEGVAWFRRGYEANKETFSNYVIALSIAGKYNQAAAIVADRYDEKPAASTAVLLVEVLLSLNQEIINPRYARIVEQAAEAYPENASLHESLGTWAMLRGEQEKAISLYLRALRIDERRLRSLNNLAMIFAEIPGRELNGLEYINRSIKIAGEDPELLDTKGTVLLRGKKVEEAIVEFSKAITDGKEKNKPRYQFHMVQALVELGRLEEAKKVWNEIRFEDLDSKGLTPSERKSLNELRKRFGADATALKEAA